MIQTDSKKQRESEFTKQHTLTDRDLQKLIDEKFERARQYASALRKREDLCKENR